MLAQMLAQGHVLGKWYDSLKATPSNCAYASLGKLSWCLNAMAPPYWLALAAQNAQPMLISQKQASQLASKLQSG